MTEPEEIEAVAIIGAGARLPGARTVAEFWHNLRAGVDTISRFDRDTLLASGVSEDLLANPAYVPARGVLDGGEDFDWRFFGYSAAEARTIDPQQRVFLEVCRAACDDAALDPARFPGWIGVFAGCDAVTSGAGELTVAGLLGREKDFLATRVAYKLGLRGPAITVQTACSTSLVAVHQACQSLLNHECDAALAGGVSLWLPQTTGYLHQEEHILSADGRCRPFDADSSGTVSSNGAGVVVLRRLSDALADGDRIVAVVRGSALNNDGGEKIGYTAPSLSGQRDVIRLAMAQAGADPADLTFVEAHGTATQLGDPVEVGALTSAFRQATDRVGGCWLGSVKSNIGHTGAASGVAGLLKAALQLRHRELVPSLHFQRPNPKLDLDSSPFEVITERRPLPADGPVLGAVSSFGLGGTNAHAVLETPPRQRSGGRGPKVFCVSAPSLPALRRARAELATSLTDDDPVSAAWTLLSRPALPYRFSVPASNLEALRSDVDGTKARTARVAFVFPGQGALYPGAVEACYDTLPTFRELFDEAAAMVRRRWQLDLHALVAADAPEKPLRDSLVQQLGLFSIGYALGRQLLDWGVRPVAMLGHSAGEYAATALAGVWGLADGLELVAARAQAMRKGPPGGMIAVYAAPSEVASLTEGYGLAVATDGPGQVVLAGSTDEVRRLGAALAGGPVNATVLDADRPFHTRDMRPATDDLRTALARLRPAPATLPIVSNLTGRMLDPDRLRDPEYWVDHMCGTVRLTDGMTTVLAQECDVVVELGPGQTMTGGLRRHEKWTGDHTAVALTGRATEPRQEALLTALGKLWETGVPVGWDDLFPERPVPCSLPPTPLDSQPLVPSGPLAGAVDWPRPDGRRLSDRPDLREALNEYAAGLLGRFVLDSGFPQGRLPRLAAFVRDTLTEQGWWTGSEFVQDVERRVSAALARAAELDEVAGLRELLRHCAESYPDVFAGRVEPVAVLYPGGTDHMLHNGLTGNRVPIADSDPCLAALCRSIPAWSTGRPLRVLEVGAGRGGLTWPLLDAWTDRAHVSYEVTDVSPLLVSELDKVATERGERAVRASVLDITKDPVAQGLTPGAFDLVIGYNVVHIAPSVPAALANLRRLLRTGGNLVLVELTRADRWTHLVWGLAPGWWNAADELRASFPHMDLDGWTAALADAGFDTVTAESAPGSADPDHAVLVATKSHSPATVHSRRSEHDDPLTRLWSAALGVRPVSDSDNFYHLGGESLGVVHLLGRVHEETGVRVPMAEFAASPTFGALRARVRGDSAPRHPNLVRLSEGGDGTPLFLTAPGAGSTLCYRHLVPLLGGKEPVYGLESPGLHDEAEPLHRIEDMAAENLRLVREIQPHGPYRLGGWSTGAMIAHEMAVQLRSAGEQVERLLCVDGFVPRTWLGPIGSRPGYLARGLWYQARTALPLGGISSLGDRFVAVYHANVRAMLRYVPRPAGCPAVIFKTGLTGRMRRRVHRDTAPLYPESRLIGVPGDHHTTLLPRHAPTLAARLREVLDD